MDQPIRAWHIGEHGEVYAGRCDEEGIKQFFRELCGQPDGDEGIASLFKEIDAEALDAEIIMTCEDTGEKYHTSFRKEAEQAGDSLPAQICTTYL